MKTRALSTLEIAHEVASFYPEVRTLEEVVRISRRLETHFLGGKEIKAIEWLNRIKKLEKTSR